jgi:multimeric flavodoxin WrbA
MSAVAILGSARSNGNTAKVLSRLLDKQNAQVFDLNELALSRFDYRQSYPPDRFLDIVRAMIAAPITIFATPVYWYSYSAIMKGFVDRLSDLLMSQKDLGRQLRGRSFALLTSSEEAKPDPDLVSAFSRLCEYMGVNFVGCVHAEADGSFVDEIMVDRVRQLMDRAETISL